MINRLKTLFGLGAEKAISTAEGLVGDTAIHEYNLNKLVEQINEAKIALDAAEAQQHLNKKKYDNAQEDILKYETALAHAKQAHAAAIAQNDQDKADKIMLSAKEVATKKKHLIDNNKLMMEQYEQAMEDAKYHRQLIEEHEKQIKDERDSIVTIKANDAALKAHKENEKIFQQIQGIETGGKTSALSSIRQKQELEMETMRVTRERQRKAKDKSSPIQELNNIIGENKDSLPWD